MDETETESTGPVGLNPTSGTQEICLTKKVLGEDQGTGKEVVGFVETRGQ